jgi:excisionase family DNA binding protein
MTSRRDQAASALLTVEAAAERLSTSPRFIRRLIAERRIEFVRVGRMYGSANPHSMTSSTLAASSR